MLKHLEKNLTQLGNKAEETFVKINGIVEKHRSVLNKYGLPQDEHLHDCSMFCLNYLDKFNPTKGTLEKHVVNIIYSYARNAANQFRRLSNKQLLYSEILSYFLNKNGESVHQGETDGYKGFLTENDMLDHYVNTRALYKAEDNIDMYLHIEEIRNKLDPKRRKVLDLKMAGLTLTQIAKEIKQSISMVSYLLTSIPAHLQNNLL